MYGRVGKYFFAVISSTVDACCGQIDESADDR